MRSFIVILALACSDVVQGESCQIIGHGTGVVVSNSEDCSYVLTASTREDLYDCVANGQKYQGQVITRKNGLSLICIEACLRPHTIKKPYDTEVHSLQFVGNRRYRFQGLARVINGTLIITFPSQSLGAGIFDQNDNLIGIVVATNSRETKAIPVEGFFESPQQGDNLEDIKNQLENFSGKLERLPDKRDHAALLKQLRKHPEIISKSIGRDPALLTSLKDNTSSLNKVIGVAKYTPHGAALLTAVSVATWLYKRRKRKQINYERYRVEPQVKTNVRTVQVPATDHEAEGLKEALARELDRDKRFQQTFDRIMSSAREHVRGLAIRGNQNVRY